MFSLCCAVNPVTILVGGTTWDFLFISCAQIINNASPARAGMSEPWTIRTFKVQSGKIPTQSGFKPGITSWKDEYDTYSATVAELWLLCGIPNLKKWLLLFKITRSIFLEILTGVNGYLIPQVVTDFVTLWILFQNPSNLSQSIYFDWWDEFFFFTPHTSLY